MGSVLKSLCQRWRLSSLTPKLLLPGAALAALSVIGAAVVLSRTTNVVHRCISYRQINAEAETVAHLLDQRSQALSVAGGLLAEDPDVLQELQGEAEATSDSLKNRVLAVQDRFDLSLVQVYDQGGRLRLELVRPRERLSASTSSLILNMAESGKTVARAVDNTLLLLCQRELPGDVGTVVVGTDLEAELQRMRLEEGLSAELGLTLRGTNVGTDAGLPFSDQSFPAVPQYYRTRFILLGLTPAELLLAQPVREVGRVTRVAVIVAVATALVTALSLSIMNGVTVRSLTGSLRTLSRAMKAAGQGRAAQEVRLPSNLLTIGEGDELGLLVDAYNEMTVRLRDHCAELEAEVEVYGAGLATVADVARAVASSFQLEMILKESTEIIQARLGEVCPNVHHVGIFLVEDDPNVMVLKELAGEAKPLLMRKGLRVPVGSKSPIGRAAATRRPQIVRNVKLASAHLKPPLLMDTYSAVAVPLLTGDSLIGILDVQSRQPAAFPPTTLPLLNVLAHQIASAVHNARSFQQQRRIVKRLAEVDQLKTQFLAVMSHRFHAPLRTVTRLSNALLEKTDGALTGQQKRDIGLIHSLSQHLAELTDDFLDVSRIKAGSTTLSFKDVDKPLLTERSRDGIAPLVEDRPRSQGTESKHEEPIDADVV